MTFSTSSAITPIAGIPPIVYEYTFRPFLSAPISLILDLNRRSDPNKAPIAVPASGEVRREAPPLNNPPIKFAFALALAASCCPCAIVPCMIGAGVILVGVYPLNCGNAIWLLDSIPDSMLIGMVLLVAYSWEACPRP